MQIEVFNGGVAVVGFDIDVFDARSVELICAYAYSVGCGVAAEASAVECRNEVFAGPLRRIEDACAYKRRVGADDRQEGHEAFVACAEFFRETEHDFRFVLAHAHAVCGCFCACVKVGVVDVFVNGALFAVEVVVVCHDSGAVAVGDRQFGEHCSAVAVCQVVEQVYGRLLVVEAQCAVVVMEGVVDKHCLAFFEACDVDSGLVRVGACVVDECRVDYDEFLRRTEFNAYRVVVDVDGRSLSAGFQLVVGESAAVDIQFAHGFAAFVEVAALNDGGSACRSAYGVASVKYTVGNTHHSSVAHDSRSADARFALFEEAVLNRQLVAFKEDAASAEILGLPAIEKVDALYAYAAAFCRFEYAYARALAVFIFVGRFFRSLQGGVVADEFHVDAFVDGDGSSHHERCVFLEVYDGVVAFHKHQRCHFGCLEGLFGSAGVFVVACRRYPIFYVCGECLRSTQKGRSGEE